MRALLLVAGAARALTARRLLNGTCASLAKRLDDGFLLPRLEKALQAAKPPAVQVFVNAAHSILLENFLCGLPRKDLRDHVVVWAADAATNARMRSYLPSVRIVDVSSAFGSSEDAPFQSEAYAEFAAVKALMPHAAAALAIRPKRACCSCPAVDRGSAARPAAQVQGQRGERARRGLRQRRLVSLSIAAAAGARLGPRRALAPPRSWL